MKTVHTYYEPIVAGRLQPPQEMELLGLWEQRWRARGWVTRVLTRDDARKHPRYDALVGAVNALPTVNPRLYEEACFLRWAALSAVGGGLQVDYDVFDLCWEPDDYGWGFGMSFDPGLTPCAIAGPPGFFDHVIEGFINYTPPPGADHVSDQTVFWEKDGFGVARVGGLVYPPDDGPLVHIPAALMRGQPFEHKVDLVRHILAGYDRRLKG